jgi:hypothetical protein
MFELSRYGRAAYLAQSSQFSAEMAIAVGVDLVFEIGPLFRAEPSFTSRHATESASMDVELAGVEDVMAFEEQMLAHAIAKVAEVHGEAVRQRFGRTDLSPCQLDREPSGLPRRPPPPSGHGGSVLEQPSRRPQARLRPSDRPRGAAVSGNDRGPPRSGSSDTPGYGGRHGGS